MADIRINATQWNALTEAIQRQIEQELKLAGALRPEDHIVPDPEAPLVDEITTDRLTDWICKMACELAAAAGKVACFKLVNPAAILLGLGVVEEARKQCRKRC